MRRKGGHQSRVQANSRCGKCGKVGYVSRALAKKAMRTLHSHEYGAVSAYRCQHGGHWWHVGHHRRLTGRWPAWRDAATEQRCTRCAVTIPAGDPIATADGDDLCLDCGDRAEQVLLVAAPPPPPLGEAPTDAIPEQCRPETVTGINGEPITVAVLGAHPMNDEDRTHLEAIVQAAQRRHASEHPETR